LQGRLFPKVALVSVFVFVSVSVSVSASVAILWSKRPFIYFSPSDWRFI
jgi:hypothetical protein